MDNLENELPQTTPQSEFKDSQGQYESLASLLVSVLVLMVVLAGVFDLFLFRQVKNARADLANVRAGLAQLQGRVVAVNEFAHKLQEYGRTHADFMPILTKYGIKPAAPGNALPEMTTPAAHPPSKK